MAKNITLGFLFVMFCVSIGWHVVRSYSMDLPVLSKVDQSSHIKGETTREAKDLASHGQVKEQESVFVPYWSDMSTLGESDFDRYIYFGIAPNLSGVDTQEPGYTNLSTFRSSLSEKADPGEALLTIRMVDAELNQDILNDPSTWENIITESVLTAQEYEFDGIVLDLEMGLLAAFGNWEGKITDFNAAFYDKAQEQGFYYALTLYGDTFYRSRPYDIKSLAQSSDEVLIMAYDFTKSFGKPGPNFPFSSGDEYRYDFQQMITDYRTSVPAEKISVIFGMYGYEWLVDEQGKSADQGSPVTLNEIRSRYLTSQCNGELCTRERDEVSAESRITAEGESGEPVIIWFEDEESVETKRAFLREQGIGSVGYWAWGYW